MMESDYGYAQAAQAGAILGGKSQSVGPQSELDARISSLFRTNEELSVAVNRLDNLADRLFGSIPQNDSATKNARVDDCAMARLSGATDVLAATAAKINAIASRLETLA